MRVYLAAAFRRRLEMRAVAELLKSHGIEITSRWLDEQPCPAEGMSSLVAALEARQEGCPRRRFLRETACMDLRDIEQSDVLVRFSDAAVINPTIDSIPRDLGTGARMVEVGYALARGKCVLVVGGEQNVFDYLPQVQHLHSVNDLIVSLTQCLGGWHVG